MNITVACHVHSDWSYDGSWPLEKLASEFSARGYRVLMMTEHDRGFSAQKWRQYREKCAQVCSEKILVVPGIEYSDAANVVHVLTWGDVLFLGEDLSTGAVVREVAQAGGIAVMAHPSRKNAWRSFDPAWAEPLAGVEVWNRKTDGWRPSPRGLGLIERSGLPPFVGLDFHDRRQMFPLAMRIDVDGAPNERSVLECFGAGKHQACFHNVALTRSRLRALSALAAPPEAARRSIRWIYRRLSHSSIRNGSPEL